MSSPHLCLPLRLSKRVLLCVFFFMHTKILRRKDTDKSYTLHFGFCSRYLNRWLVLPIDSEFLGFW